MNLILKEKKIIYSIIQLCKLFYKNNKKLFVLDLVMGFSRECKKIIGLILPTIIIETLLLGQSISSVLLVILILSLLNAIFGIAVESILRYQSNYSLRATNSLYYILNGKSAHLDLKDCEDEDVINRYYEVFDNIYDLSDVPYDVFCSLISKTASFVAMCIVIASINIGLLGLVLAINFIILAIQTKQNTVAHKYDLMVSQHSDKLKYLYETFFGI